MSALSSRLRPLVRGRTAQPRPRPRTALVALVLGVLLAGAAPAAAAPVAITTGAGLDWGVKQSWRTYISPAGTTVSAGAMQNLDGTFHFPVIGGEYEPTTKTTVVRFGGTVEFLGHCDVGFERPCALDTTLSDPRVEISEDGTFLHARLKSKPMAGGEIVEYPDVQLASLDTEAATPAVTESTTTWSGLPARITREGELFGYAAGTVIDPVTFGYDGPGGKPAVEAFAEAAAPEYTRTALTAATFRPRFTYPGRTTDELVGVGLSPRGLAVLDRDTFAVEPGSLDASFRDAFGSVATDPATGTVFSGTSGANRSLSARTWDGSAWTTTVVADSAITATSTIGGATWDPGTKRYLVSRQVGTDSQLWAVRNVSGVWTAVNLGSVRQASSAPAPLIQSMTTVPNGNPNSTSIMLASWYGQVMQLTVLADGVLAEPLAQAPGVTAAHLVRVQNGVYAVASDRVRYLPFTGSPSSQTLGNVAPLDPIPSLMGLGSLDTGWVAADRGRDTLFVPSHSLSRITRIEAGVVRHAFAIPGQETLTPSTNFLAGTTTDGRLALTNHATGSPIDALEYLRTTPSFTTQPQDAVAALPAGQVTSDATFTVATAGDPAPTVRWQTRAPGDARWTDVDGGTGPELTVAATAHDGGRQYRAIATNAAGEVASERVTLDVRTPPVINVQPESVSVVEGNAALMKVMPAGNPEPVVQWQQRIDGFWRAVDVESGDFAVDGGFLTVTDPNVAMTGTQFRARLHNEVGTVFTRAVTLSVSRALASPVTFGGGHVDWGVAERWRCYVVGNVARGGIEPSGGVEQLPGTLASGSLCAGRNAGSEILRFPVLGGRYDPDRGQLVVRLGGSVRFWGHGYHVPGNPTPQLDTRISNLRLVTDGATGTLYGDTTGATLERPEPVTRTNVALVTVDLTGASPAPFDGGLGWNGLATSLTASGAEIFGSYPAGEAFDPLALTLEYGEPQVDLEPRVDPPLVLDPAPVPVPPLAPAPTPKQLPAAVVVAKVTAAKGTRTVGVSRTVTLGTIACPKSATARCRVAVPRTVRVRIGGRTYRLAVAAPKTVKAGATAAVRVTLPRAAARRLAGRTVTVRVAVKTTVAGKAKTKTVTVKLRARKARSR